MRDTEARPDRLLPAEVRGALRAPNQPSLRPTPSAMVIALAGCAVRRRTSAHAAAARGRARVSRNTVYLSRPPPLVGRLLPRDRRCSHPTCCRAATPLASLGRAANRSDVSAESAYGPEYAQCIEGDHLVGSRAAPINDLDIPGLQSAIAVPTGPKRLPPVAAGTPSPVGRSTTL